MRTFALGVIAAWLCLYIPAYAMQPVNLEMIQEAQAYGQMFSKRPVTEFLLPWTVNEEKAKSNAGLTERAYIYTPYLLIALNARDSVLKGTPVKLIDSEKILSEYAGFLTFELTMYGSTDNFAEGMKAILKQDKKIIRQYQVTSLAQAERIKSIDGDASYKAQCYVYFTDREIDMSKPIKLIVTLNDKRELVFYFDLTKLK